MADHADQQHNNNCVSWDACAAAAHVTLRRRAPHGGCGFPSLTCLLGEGEKSGANTPPRPILFSALLLSDLVVVVVQCVVAGSCSALFGRWNPNRFSSRLANEANNANERFENRCWRGQIYFCPHGHSWKTSPVCVVVALSMDKIFPCFRFGIFPNSLAKSMRGIG